MITFSELPLGTPITVQGHTWRKIFPMPNRLRSNGAPWNAVSLSIKTGRGFAVYGHFDDKFSGFELAPTCIGKVQQVAK